MNEPAAVWVVEEYPTVEAAKAAGFFEWLRGRGVFDGPVGLVWQQDGYGYTGLPGSIEVSLEHARLIAAAPDLLAACEAYVAYEDGPEERNGWKARMRWLAIDAQIRAAITKARGEQP
jgi:hypothetical protein